MIRIIRMMRVSVYLGAILIPEYLNFHSGIYSGLFKTGSLDDAIREFSLAKPSYHDLQK